MRPNYLRPWPDANTPELIAREKAHTVRQEQVEARAKAILMDYDATARLIASAFKVCDIDGELTTDTDLAIYISGMCRASEQYGRNSKTLNGDTEDLLAYANIVSKRLLALAIAQADKEVPEVDPEQILEQMECGR